jgi:glycosyltransferase involved in cell wall biosynthesis
MQAVPLLSICLPTYNRATLLEIALLGLLPQIKSLERFVEIVVCDNRSLDHTSTVVQEARQWGSIRYYKNKQNVGTENFDLCVQRALGEFVWIIGDDDMIVQGKIHKIVKTILLNPINDYFYVNYFYASVEKRNDLIISNNSFYSPKIEECYCMDIFDRQLNCWEDIFKINNTCPEEMFTVITSHIFKRSLWCRYNRLLNIKPNKSIINFDTVYPHIRVLANAMIGKPAYYIGDPCVLLGMGAQQCNKWMPYNRLVYVNEAIDLYEKIGITRSEILRLRKSLMKKSGGYLLRMIIVRGMPGRKGFSVLNYILKYYRYKELWISIFTYLIRCSVNWMTKPLTIMKKKDEPSI